MTNISENVLTDDMVIRKLTYQFDRTLQLLECLAAENNESAPFVSVIESYSRQKVELAAEQILTGWSLPDDTTCTECEKELFRNASITVRARRPLGLLTWYIDSCVCSECDVTLDPEPDSMEVIAAARITEWNDPSNYRSMMLSDIDIEDASGTRYCGEANTKVTNDA